MIHQDHGLVLAGVEAALLAAPGEADVARACGSLCTQPALIEVAVRTPMAHGVLQFATAPEPLGTATAPVLCRYDALGRSYRSPEV